MCSTTMWRIYELQQCIYSIDYEKTCISKLHVVEIVREYVNYKNSPIRLSYWRRRAFPKCTCSTNLKLFSSSCSQKNRVFFDFFLLYMFFKGTCLKDFPKKTALPGANEPINLSFIDLSKGSYHKVHMYTLWSSVNT